MRTPTHGLLFVLERTLLEVFGIKEISVSQGRKAIVDNDDYELLSQYKWYLHVSRRRTAEDLHYCWTHQVDGHNVLMHRLIMNAQPGQFVDHINGNGLDNRKANLRLCSKSQNAQNIKARWGKSRFKGVYWHKHRKKWAVEININGKKKSLGHYIDEVEAAKVYDKVARQYFGEFADVNFKANVG